MQTSESFRLSALLGRSSTLLSGLISCDKYLRRMKSNINE